MADPLRELRHGEVVWAESDETGPLTIDLDSIVEVHGRTKQGAAFGYPKRSGGSPLGGDSRPQLTMTSQSTIPFRTVEDHDDCDGFGCMTIHTLGDPLNVPICRESLCRSTGRSRCGQALPQSVSR